MTIYLFGPFADGGRISNKFGRESSTGQVRHGVRSVFGNLFGKSSGGRAMIKPPVNLNGNFAETHVGYTAVHDGPGINNCYVVETVAE